MRLMRLSANDPRFKTVEFRPGLNLIVANRNDLSTQQESRNGTGKTSVIRLLRFLFGGSLPPKLRQSEFETWNFRLDFHLASHQADVTIQRSAGKAKNRVEVHGWPFKDLSSESCRIEDWRRTQGRRFFGFADEYPSELSSSSLWAYLARDYFDSPVKSFAVEAGWLTGLKVGYFLGLSANILGKAGEVVVLERQRKALNDAISEGALHHLDLDEARLRSDLANSRNDRNRIAKRIESFRVDSEYQENQRTANLITADIRELNERLLAYQNRLQEVERAVQDDAGLVSESPDRRLGSMYEELGVLFPEVIFKRFDEVTRFHQSVVRNRALYLANERKALTDEIARLETERQRLDDRRASLMTLLRSSVAFETFIESQTQVATLDGVISELEQRLKTAGSVRNLEATIVSMRTDARRGVDQEVRDRQDFLINGPIALFSELGSEIYADRSASLLLESSKVGGLNVNPSISGDSSIGIRSVETFLLDITLQVTSLRLGRNPGVLVHDSHLFDSVDHRQVASCLNIGARLAEEHGFQYIVTMNSDFLSSVEKEGAFESSNYVLDVELTDATDSGGLFGFKFD